MHHAIVEKNAFYVGFKYTIGMRISYFCRYFIPNFCTHEFNACLTMLVLCLTEVRSCNNSIMSQLRD